jgi:hypothetical protein
MITAVFVLLFIYVTWLLYITVMHLRRVRDQLSRPVQWLAWPAVSVGVACDVLLNVLVGSLLFADPPRELLVTSRLKRYQAAPNTWRARLARWLCAHLLNPFDERHC